MSLDAIRKIFCRNRMYVMINGVLLQKIQKYIAKKLIRLISTKMQKFAAQKYHSLQYSFRHRVTIERLESGF